VLVRGRPFQFHILKSRVVFWLNHKHLTLLEVPHMDKHSSLLQIFTNYDRKKISTSHSVSLSLFFLSVPLCLLLYVFVCLYLSVSIFLYVTFFLLRSFAPFFFLSCSSFLSTFLQSKSMTFPCMNMLLTFPDKNHEKAEKANHMRGLFKGPFKRN
jgi:hypothetical protein